MCECRRNCTLEVFGFKQTSVFVSIISIARKDSWKTGGSGRFTDGGTGRMLLSVFEVGGQDFGTDAVNESRV